MTCILCYKINCRGHPWILTANNIEDKIRYAIIWAESIPVDRIYWIHQAKNEILNLRIACRDAPSKDDVSEILRDIKFYEHSIHKISKR